MARLDIIVFGATGYTGTFVVRELAWLMKKDSKTTWAVAGRSKEKLEQVLTSISKEIDYNLVNKIESVIVDIDNSDSLKKMCDRGKLIINCVGPYRFYGEKVIKQCLQTGTHHLDVSGEPEYLERMQLVYHREAEEKGVFVVGSCGFDSIPADLGVIFTQNNFKYDLNHVESYLSVEGGKDEPLSFNFATWESAVYGFASSKHLGSIRKQLFPTRTPRSSYAAPRRTNFLHYFYDSVSKKYCMDFLGSDKSVVQRTQYFNYKNNQRPIQYVPYFQIKNLFAVFIFIVFGSMFGLLANFSFGRRLLLKHYKFFSFGAASKKQTTFEEMKNIKWNMEFRGYGFDRKLVNLTEQFDQPPKKVIITKVSGPEPGYICTARFIINSALVILEEKDKLSVKGGVLTPGAAFGKSSLIERLQKNSEINFEIIRNDSIESKI